MAELVVKKLQFPGADGQYVINAVALEGKSLKDITDMIDDVREEIQAVSDFDALRYMGTIAAQSSAPGAFTPSAEKGDVYKVTGSGYVMGVKVESGDMLICSADGTAAAEAGNYVTVALNWDIVQGNIDVESILAHTHTGDVVFTKSNKTLNHSITPTTEDLTAEFKNGAASVSGKHSHTASGTVTVTTGGAVAETSITPTGSVTLTSPTNASTGDVTLTPSGTINNSSTKFVTKVEAGEFNLTHTASSGNAGGHTPSGTVTVKPITTDGSVGSHKHNVTISAPANAQFLNAPTYSGSGMDGVLTFGVGNAVSSVTVTGVEEVAPSFIGASVTPEATFSGTPVADHTHTVTVNAHNNVIAPITTSTGDHNHTFNGNNMYVHAAFNGNAASHAHTFTGASATHNVDVTVNEFNGNFSGTASGNVDVSVDKVLTNVAIDNHTIQTVDSATVTTGEGQQ